MYQVLRGVGVHPAGTTCTVSAVDDSFQITASESSITISLRDNDSVTGECGIVGLTLMTSPLSGQLAQVGLPDDGVYTYTPNPGSVGVDQFQYRLRAVAGNVIDFALVSIDVLGTPPATTQPPCVVNLVDDSYSTPFGTSLDVGPGSGIFGNDQRCGRELESVSDPAHGEVFVFPNGAFSYLPDAGFSGVDSFTHSLFDQTDSFRRRAGFAGGARNAPAGVPGNVATVSITVEPEIVPTTATPSTTSAPEPTTTTPGTAAIPSTAPSPGPSASDPPSPSTTTAPAVAVLPATR